MGQITNSLLSRANAAFSRSDYEEALKLYSELKESDHFLRDIVDFNISLCLKRLSAASAKPHPVSVRKPRTTRVEAQKSKNNLVLISCWLRKKEKIHDGLLSFYYQLQRNLMNPLMVTHTEYLIESQGVESVECSFNIEHDYKVSDECMAGVDFPTWIVEVANIERRRNIINGRKGPSTRHERCVENAKKAYFYWWRRLNDNRPKLFLIWGSTSALSKLHIKLCIDLGITYLIIERGHFPGTLSIEAGAQFGRGARSMLPHFNNVEYTYDQLQDFANELIHKVEASGEMAYSHKNRNISGDLLGKLKGECRNILILGVNDYGSGTAYLPEDCSERHSTVFRSSRACYEYISNVLKPVSGVTLIYKPHPADKNRRSENSGDVLVDDVSVNDLIKCSDVVVTMSSTVIATAILYQKPVVVCGISDFNATDSVYACKDISEVLPNIRAALYKDGYYVKRDNGLRALKNLVDSNLVDVAGGGIGGVSLSDFSGHIAGLANLLERDNDRFLDPNYIYSTKRFRSNPSGGWFRCRIKDGAWKGSSNKITVVVPLYDGFVETVECLKSLAASFVNIVPRVVLVWDSGPNQELRDFCKDFADENGYVWLVNEENLGYSGSVNRAILFCQPDDVVLLNSDTLVSRGWLDRLSASAYSSHRIATATPFSNNAGIFSNPFPGHGVELKGGIDYVVKKDEQAARNNWVVEVPAGHGFCMFIKRSAITMVGLLDEAVFGRGYSEEIDFCLRCRKFGLVNVCATNVYVGHVGGVSFGSDAEALKDENRDKISALHYGYYDERKAFQKVDRMREFRVD